MTSSPIHDFKTGTMPIPASLSLIVHGDEMVVQLAADGDDPVILQHLQIAMRNYQYA